MKSKNFEIAKLALLNEQMGSIKNLEVSFKEESLSDEDKELIKQAVLEHAKSYGGKGALELAKELREAFILINQ
ncbi:hypothetical protein PTQ27_09150 [Mannheimia sp. AT1]|uniref:Phage protein n=1 Tax=Mannheimia cairinae TaxID=3025936 RepID=A0ABT5MRM5_9PAST|nr:hypothetical protein [Mannheimia cairinae]MDD0824623.1 hypothetical protein [Mannheimia cairinae]MDD0826448.1 hypothetical protein [Mannheimia cairinae]